MLRVIHLFLSITVLFGLIAQTYVLLVLNWGNEIAINEDKEQCNIFYQYNNSFCCESK